MVAQIQKAKKGEHPTHRGPGPQRKTLTVWTGHTADQPFIVDLPYRGTLYMCNTIFDHRSPAHREAGVYRRAHQHIKDKHGNL